MKWNKVKKLMLRASILAFTITSAFGFTACSMKFNGDVSEIGSGVGEVLNEIKNTTIASISETFDNKTSKEATSEPVISAMVDDIQASAEKIANITDTKFQEATLVRVVDGDTIVVNINNEDYKVRLIGINTPESVASQEYLDKTGKENTKEGVAASEYTKTILSGVKQVYLEKDKSDTDRYGRLLRYVWLSVPEDINTQTIAEQMLNGMLLTSGAEKAAEPARYKPDTKYADEFDEIYENW